MPGLGQYSESETDIDRLAFLLFCGLYLLYHSKMPPATACMSEVKRFETENGKDRRGVRSRNPWHKGILGNVSTAHRQLGYPRRLALITDGV
jgi:hypothetical protein